MAIQYVLLAGVNDAIDDARRLRDLFLATPVKIDLIRYNAIPEASFRPTDPATEQRFAEVLFTAGVQVTRRTSRGRDALAACGQLRRVPPTHSLGK